MKCVSISWNIFRKIDLTYDDKLYEINECTVYIRTCKVHLVWAKTTVFVRDTQKNVYLLCIDMYYIAGEAIYSPCQIT